VDEIGPEIPDVRSALGFLIDREDYFRVFVVRDPSDGGWDVVLRVDGSYETQEIAAHAAERIRDQLLEVRDLDHSRWFSWEG
jgi:hypothetical protein